jgi:hypothetical protein
MKRWRKKPKAKPKATVSRVKYGTIKTPLGSGVVIGLKAKVSNS